MNEKLLGIIIIAVTIVFIGNFILAAVNQGYQPDPTIGPIMGTIAGGAIAWASYNRAKKDDDRK